MGRSVIGPELTEGVEEPHGCPKTHLRVHDAATSQLQARKRTLLALDSLMGNRRVMFECHKQRGLMHSLGCSGAEGPHNIILPLSAQNLNRNGGGGDKRVSPANDSVAAAHVICDPAAKKSRVFVDFYCNILFR